MSVRHIDVGREFSLALGQRYRHLGPHSGEEFRDDILEPAFKAFLTIVVDFDNVKGYSASFLEEAFGGLVRNHGLDAVKKKLKIVSLKRPYLLETIERRMLEAEKHRNKA